MGILGVQPLGAIGSAGQNTQTDQIDLPPQFATAATNCYVDQSGRLTARKSIIRRTADNNDLTTTAGVKRIYRHNKANGTSEFVCSGNNRIFTGDTATLTSRSSGHSADLWQFATLNGKLFAAQASHSIRWFNETTWAETTFATPSNPRAILSAFGRLWALSSDGWTLYWSDLLDGTNFTTGASGSLDLSKLHTTVRSEAVAITALGRQIVVLCKSQIIVLGLADDLNPNNSTTPIYMADSISGVGCAARDTVVATGDDVMFLAPDGVRSLRRSLAEQQGPASLNTLSLLNKNAVIDLLAAETSAAAVAACWDYKQSWYQVFFPTAEQVWTFDMSRAQGGEGPATTVWQMGTRDIYHGATWTDDAMWYGTVGGLADNSEYDATDSYNFVVETGWLSLGLSSTLKHLKTMLINARGGSGQTATLKWYVDFNEGAFRSATFTLSSAEAPAEYGIAEYNVDEFTTGITAVDSRMHLGNSAKFVKFVVSIPISGRTVTINNAQVFTNRGRIK